MWVSTALAFNLFVYFAYEHHWLGIGFVNGVEMDGGQAALEFFTAWVVEESLSLDNIFVIATVMAYFRIPAESQHRLLYWGVLGALVMRFVFILSGLALVQRFAWTTYIFGGILIVTALKMLIQKEEELHPERNSLVRLFQRFMPVKCELHGTGVLRPSRRRLARDADVRRAARGRELRPAVRDRLAARGDRGDRGSVHRVQLERVRDPGAAQPLLRDRADDRALPLHEAEPDLPARLHRREDAARPTTWRSRSPSRSGSSRGSSRSGCSRRSSSRQEKRAASGRALGRPARDNGLRTAWRVVVGVVGATVLALGLAMLVLPGPGLLVIPIGLAILASEFVWARRWLARIRGNGTRPDQRSPSAWRCCRRQVGAQPPRYARRSHPSAASRPATETANSTA